MQTRCSWCEGDPLYTAYHDEEWGQPIHGDRLLFEFLILEGMQAGLSWITILKRREGFRKAFAQFDAHKIAKFTEADIEKLMQNPDVIRHRKKIEGAVINAKLFLEVQKEFGSFDRYIWQFTGGKQIQNRWKQREEVPCSTPISDALAKDLKKRGFKFVGTTICYAFMQAVGMVNDHVASCFRSVDFQ